MRRIPGLEQASNKRILFLYNPFMLLIKATHA